MIPPTSKLVVMRKAKAMFEKVCQFMVAVVSPFNGRTAMQPTAPPMKDMMKASIRNENTTAAAPKPSARMVAISRPRSATAEYMVLRAPKIAPMAMTPATSPPRMVMSWVMRVDCLA